MAQRTRSPNYPSISLPAAFDRLGRLWPAIGSNLAPRDVVLKSMGYSSANGASLSVLSAVQKYGLLERKDDEFRISERGQQYLHPESAEERHQAIQEAAQEPKLFAELGERFSGGPASDDLIRNHLIRKGFSVSAASTALLSYRETLAFVESTPGGDSPPSDSSSSAQSIPAKLEGGADALIPQESQSPGAAIAKARPAEAGKFRVSMTDEFLVDVSATRLDRAGVERLVAWLQANRELVPEPKAPSGEDDVDD